MKRIFFFLLMMVSLTIKAQETYSNFLEDGKVWKYHYYNYFTSLEYDFSLFVSGDTLINGRQYKKICRDTADKVECALRQEGQQIYMANESGEKIVYDFSLNIGNLYQNDEACVSAIDTIKVGSRLFRRFRFSELPSESRTDYWIEGIGGTGYLLNQLWTVGPTITLLSCEVNGETILRRDDIFDEQYHSSDYHPLLKDGKCWYGKEVSSFIDKEFTYNYYLSGDTLIGDEWFHKCYCLRERGNESSNALVYYAALQEKDRRVYAVVRDATEKKLILDFNLQVGDSLHCEYGLSFLEIVPEGGDVHYVLEKIDSVAAFDGSPLRRYWFKNCDRSWYEQWIEGVGTSAYPFTWNYLISSYGYALQGCYEDGVLFYGNPIPDSIMMLNTSCSNDSHSSFYDLQGRRINGQPQKGMYIRDGKKYVK